MNHHDRIGSHGCCGGNDEGDCDDDGALVWILNIAFLIIFSIPITLDVLTEPLRDFVREDFKSRGMGREKDKTETDAHSL